MRTSLLATALVLVACAVGCFEDDDDGGTPNQPSGTSSGQGAGASSGATSSSGNDAGDCPQVKLGGKADESIGGSQASRTIVQAAIEIADLAESQLVLVTGTCFNIATDLGIGGQVTEVLENEPDPVKRVKAVCDLAEVMIDREFGSVESEFVGKPATCEPSNDIALACEQGCVPASASCSQVCGALGTAKASCTGTTAKMEKGTDALKATVASNYAAILAARARNQALVEAVPHFSAALSSIDVKPACLAATVGLVTTAANQVQAPAPELADLLNVMAK